MPSHFTHRISSRLLRGLGAISFPLLCACNPTVFGGLVDNAPVRTFSVVAPTAGNPYGNEGFRLPGGAGQDGAFVMVAPGIPLLSRVAVSNAGDGESTHPQLPQLQSIMGPLSDIDTSTFGGVARVPAPIMADSSPHAVVGITSTFEPWLARVVRLDLRDFDRTDTFDMDIESPRVAGGFISGFGQDIAAINLEGDPTSPDYEVAVGSSMGLLIFDSVGQNTADYLAQRDQIVSMNPNAFLGDAESDGFHFTFCSELADYVSIGAGNFGAAGTPAFVVASQGGLTLIGDQSQTNAVGAPVYDCSARFIAKQGAPSETHGLTLFTTDINDDGNDDLFVGDPESNEVAAYLGTGDGLPSEASFFISPDLTEDNVKEFGYAVDVADLGGGFGRALVVGAPGTRVNRKNEVGSVYVYRVNDMGMLDLESPIEIHDLDPREGSRHGLWAGGIRNDARDRDELVVMGATEGRVHLMVDDLDPSSL